METLVNYGYYNDVYKGKEISQDVFMKKMFSVENFLRRRTQGQMDCIRNEKDLEILKYTLCQLLELDMSFEVVGNVSAKSLGDSSVTFNSNYEDERGYRREQIVKENLYHLGVLRNGFYMARRWRW